MVTTDVLAPAVEMMKRSGSRPAFFFGSEKGLFMISIKAQSEMVRSTRSKAETKADTTDRVARKIIETETRIQRSKTEELRKARLENEAQKTGSQSHGGETGKDTRGKRTSASSTSHKSRRKQLS